MIELPRRSVTRFFIPLIDVLTLLFCIFLLMPVMKGKAEGSDEAERRPGNNVTDDPLAADAAALARRVARAQQDLERLRTEKIETLQRRLAIQVVEIDASTGKLFYYEGGSRVEIANQAEARALIDRHKRNAVGKELYYLILFPRQVTGYPEKRQLSQYERWFEGVAHAIDNPRQ